MKINVSAKCNLQLRSFYRKKYLISLYSIDGLCTGTYDNVYHLAYTWGLDVNKVRHQIDSIFRRESYSIKINNEWYDVFFTKVSKC